MRLRASKIKFEDFFSPADLAHVDWMMREGRSLLGARGGAKSEREHGCAGCSGRDCLECSGEAERYERADAGRIAPPEDFRRERGVVEGALHPSYEPDADGRWHGRRISVDQFEQATTLDDVMEDPRRPLREHSLVDRSDRWAAREPGSGPAGSRTLEYDPERDRPVAQELIQFKGNKIKFRPLRESAIYDGRGNWYPAVDGVIEADNGELIEAKRNLSGVPNLDTNCHGHTFARGKVHIEPDQVDKILTNDGYCRVDLRGVRPGDVVIYRRDGYPVHSARVVAIVNGTVIVEGKIGQEPGLKRTPYDRQWPPPTEPEEVAEPEFYSQRCARRQNRIA